MIILITTCLCLLYAIFLFWCLYHWNKLPSNTYLENSKEIKVAVIVPVRNESKNIHDLIDSIASQKYSNFEIIIADDHSTDDTIALTNKWIADHDGVKVKCISSLGESKKAAISHAVNFT